MPVPTRDPIRKVPLAPEDATRWLWRPQPRPDARFRVFCFPFAGGGPRVFQGWERELPPDVELVAVRLPARDSRFGEPPIDDWGSLLERVTAALAPMLDRPFALYGHSFGARLAFQIAARVQDMPSSALRLLAISGCSPSHRGFFHPGLGELPAPEFFRRLGELGGMPAEALEEQAFLTLIEPALRADIRLSEAWHALGYQAVHVPVLAFAGREDALAPPAYVHEWADYARDDFSCHELSGDHFFLREQAGYLLATIDRRLRTADAAAPVLRSSGIAD